MQNVKPSEVIVHDEKADPNDLRLRNIMENYRDGVMYDVGLIGVPFDYGVKLSNGRVGAKLGPDAFRKALKRYGTTYNIENKIDISGLKICDFGNVDVVDNDSSETHMRVSSVVSEVLKTGAVPVIIGGGHDISFADVRGLCMASGGHIGGINIDAHFDVREVRDGNISSGTPFRRVIEELDGRIDGRNFVELGAHDNLNSKAHHGYLESKGVNVITLDDMRLAGIDDAIGGALKAACTETEAAFLSIDMDAMQGSAAPGCSAPSPRGVSPDEIVRAAFECGVNGKVKMLDIMELNPEYDTNEMTAILAVTIFVGFLNGFSRRKS